MGDVQLDYVVPGAELAPYVTLFYRFRADVPEFVDTERADHAQLRFRLSPGDAHYLFPDGSRQSAPPYHVLGATSGAIRTHVVGPVKVFGMGLTPLGWATLIGTDASAMANRVFDAETVLGDGVAEAGVALRNASDGDAMVAAVMPLLRRLIGGDTHRPALGFVRAVDAWLAGAFSPDIEDLAAATGLSRRQVERRCNALYGAPPKLLARKYRALRAAVAMASHDADIDALIGEGFYDQSHMIREIKQFTGLTPGQVRGDSAPLTQMTIERRHALVGKVHPIISDT
ncbi:MAG TPA: AraC family transcriptional regulator [Sphingomonas sp.]|jgi:AraC-like DNA-binding protein|nr:AraC family transcriptional regulator [Sphingomonas sp.]